MDADAIINEAIDLGERDGLAALGPVHGIVYMISEAEVCCDMDGIDSLLDRYGVESMVSFAQAFLAVGATEIAHVLTNITSCNPVTCEALLARANSLITSRAGYSYESIRAFVADGT